MNAVDHGLELEVMVVVADLEARASGILSCCIQLGCDLADVGFGTPPGWIDVGLNDRLDTKLNSDATDLVLVAAEHVDVCGWRRQSCLAQSSTKPIGELDKLERFDL